MTATPWPIAIVGSEVPHHSSAGLSRPADSPGNPVPVELPSPNERR